MNKTKVFEAGTQSDYTYSNDDVKAIAEAYTETAYSAPWVCGHDAKSGDPAMGWVRGLEYTEEAGVGTLWAESDFNKVGQSLIDDGLYENKSVSFYTPDSVFNPAPGQWSLRHIAMLGAEPPALKDLGPIAVIDYSEEDSVYVSYNCGCGMNNLKPDLQKEYSDLEEKLSQIKKAMESESETVLEDVVETIIETVLEQAEDEMTELEQIKEERDQLLAQLNASKEANTALSISAAVSPYYSEGILTEDVLPESTLTNVLTKLTLGTTNYAEEETPIIVIETLLRALIGSKPEEPQYGEETTTVVDLPSKTVTYSDGDELHSLATKTATTYGLSYGQALSAVVMAQETAVVNKVNFSESLAEAVKGFKMVDYLL